MVKLNATDGFRPNSQRTDMKVEISQAIETAKVLEKAGVCAIEVSEGLSKTSGVAIRLAINSSTKEAYFREYSKAIKKAVNIPVILVGGIRSLSMMEHLLENRSEERRVGKECRS